MAAPAEVVIRLSNVGKMYKMFASRRDNFVDTVGLGRVLPWLRVGFREFWALREINLELERGRRIGIIGRNGAGKSTLLKLITGNLDPTVGRVEVTGQVQALLDAGAGFHPEFTGRENVHASLTYRGLTREQIDEALVDIADFTELADFLDQPYKAYSLGMQARLAFATATVVKPQILVIDEILGAGDAYFLSKSRERMVKLVSGGASLLLVSHSLDQITQFCDEALWIDRGRIAMRGPSMEIVKAYEQHIRVLDDRRLRAKNREARRSRVSPRSTHETRESLFARFVVSGPNASCEVAELKLWKDAEVEDSVLVGNAQDADPSQSAFVSLEADDWSAPRESDGGLCRALITGGAHASSTSGRVAFNPYLLAGDAAYAIEVLYRLNTGELALEIYRNGALQSRVDLPAAKTWISHRVALGGELEGEASVVPRGSGIGKSRVAESRWPGEGSLRIDAVELLGADNREQAVFEVGTPMTLRVNMVAQVSGAFDVIPVAVLYRIDGVRVSSHVGKKLSLALTARVGKLVSLRYDPLNLGNGTFVFSVALYRVLDSLGSAELYDLLDRSYEFQVVGNEPLQDGIFRHPAEWCVE